MANLESMFIEVSGDASKASSSIDKLVVSLNKLVGVVASVTPAMKELATSLKEIQQISTNTKINWKNMMPTVSKNTMQNMKQTASAMRSSASTMNKYASSFQNMQATISGQNPMTNSLGQTANNAAGSTGNQYAAQMQQLSSTTNSATQSSQNYANANQLAAQATQQLAQTTQQTGKAIKNTSNATKSATSSMKKHANDAKKIAFHFGSIGGSIKRAFSQIFRMAKSMIIRNALRAMISGAKEGLENYYNYSKTVGNGFSDTMDQMAGTAAQMKNQLGAALASAIMTLAPALNTLADAAMRALEAITALFAALGGRSTYSRAKKQTAEFTAETKKAGGAVKDLLADFDELNVITSGGGGGGGGGATPNYGDMWEEVDVPEWAKAVADLLPVIAAVIAAAKAWGALKWLLDLFDKIKNTKIPKAPNIPPVNTPDWSSFMSQLDQIVTKIGEINAAITQLTVPTIAWQKELAVVMGYLLAIGAELLLLSLPKLKIKIDRDAYDDWKKDFEALSDDLENNPRTLKINVKVNMREFTYAITLINGWVNQTPTKKINVNVNDTAYYTKVGLIEAWVNRPDKKYIDVGFDPTTWSTFWNKAKLVNDWTTQHDVKVIDVVFDTHNLTMFKAVSAAIDNWANQRLTKVIDVVVNTKTKGGSSGGIVGSALTQGVTDSIGKGIVNSVFPTNPAQSSGLTDDEIRKHVANTFAKNTVASQTEKNALSFPEKLIHGDFTGATADIIGVINDLLRADGGTVNRGDLFIANEQGAELIGSINGKTSVANQEQIIEGISRGVESANAEQNALLRQQNDLLRSILNKETSVKFGASASLGRTVRQSLDLYADAVGGR